MAYLFKFGIIYLKMMARNAIFAEGNIVHWLKIKVLLVSSVMCWVLCGQMALASGNYFAAKVPVASQSSADRSEALSRALASVLVKVSGRLDAPLSDLGIEAMTNAGKYVSQFRYMQASQQDKEAGVTLFLKANFDADRIRELIKNSGLAVWPENRPQVLVWVVADTPETGRVPIIDLEHPLIQGLLTRAADRGLPVLFPLWDLDDQLMLPADALWALNDEAIMAAAARYDVNTVLAARYSQTTSGRWFANWQLRHLDQLYTYDAQSQEVDSLAEKAIDPTVDYLAERYAIEASNDETEVLQILHLYGVSDYVAYQDALNYFTRLPLISEAKLVSLKNDHMVLHVSLAGSWEQLNNALALDRKVKSVMGELDAVALSVLGSSNSPARYQWVH